MRGLRWLAAIMLVGWCVALLGCSSPTSTPAKPSNTEKEPVKKPTGEVG